LQGLICLAQGKNELKDALYEPESPDMDYVYDAYDQFKEVVKHAHGNNNELEAIGLMHIGKLQYQVFKCSEKAKNFYRQCITLAFGLCEGGQAEKNSYLAHKDWFNTASKHLNEIQ
jgi:hypothetical protein